MSLLDLDPDNERYKCQKDILSLPADIEIGGFIQTETPIEVKDKNEKSRLVEQFNKSHQKPGFKVSR